MRRNRAAVLAAVATLLTGVPTSAWAAPDVTAEDGVAAIDPSDAAHKIRLRIQATAGGLGSPTSGIQCTDQGCVQTFTQATVTVTPGRDAQVIRDPFRKTFDASRSFIGFPLSDQVCGLTADGCVQTFSGDDASIYWSPATGPALVKGELKAAWLAAGAEFGEPGYPLGSEECSDLGCIQQFEHSTITWSPQRGSVVVSGAIRDHWLATGGEQGHYGWPASKVECQDPQSSSTACTQQFQRGKIRWTQSNGVQIPV